MNEKLLKVLSELSLEKRHNLLCYSKNILCIAPKEGYESEFEIAKKELKEILQLIEYYGTEEI